MTPPPGQGVGTAPGGIPVPGRAASATATATAPAAAVAPATAGGPPAAGAPGTGRTRTRARADRAATLGLPAVAAGMLLAFSLPPWGWWPLAFAGAALLFWRLDGLGWRDRLAVGWLAGMGCFVPGLWWAASFNWYGAAALMVAEALFVAVGAAAVPARAGRIPAFAAGLVLVEAARAIWPFGGLPLGGVFLGQAGGPLLGAARLGGPLALTAAVWLGGAGLATLVQAAADACRHRATPGHRARPAVPGAVAVALVVALGIAGALAPRGGPVVRRLTVAAVQGGGRRGTSAIHSDPARVLSAQLAATRRLLGPGAPHPALVVWPEDVVALSATHLAGTPQAAAMSGLARRLGATVVAGVTEPVPPGAFRNEAVVWGPDGRITGRYEKVHRVPFGEYVPDRALFAQFANLVAVPLDAVPGHGTGELTTPAARIGLMISYEVFFAGRGRSAVRAGAQLLVVPTNTSSYVTTQVPDLEVAADRVQAVAEGRTLVQAAPAGYSTVVDPSGAVLARSTLGARQVLVARVGLRRGATVYERAGDLPVLVVAAAAWCAGWLAAVRRRGAGRRRAQL